MTKDLENEIDAYLKTQQEKLQNYQKEKVIKCFEENYSNPDLFSQCYNQQYQQLKKISKEQETKMMFFQMSLQKCIKDSNKVDQCQAQFFKDIKSSFEKLNKIFKQ